MQNACIDQKGQTNDSPKSQKQKKLRKKDGEGGHFWQKNQKKKKEVNRHQNRPRGGATAARVLVPGHRKKTNRNGQEAIKWQRKTKRKKKAG